MLKVAFALVLLSIIQIKAQQCSTENCQLPNCACASTNVPGGLDPKTIPQLVFLTFDDAVNTINFEYYRTALFGRTNPDGCPVAATYFVSHEYTDYSRVHALYSEGHEIAVHSITHTPEVQYWLEATREICDQEFGGQRQILAHFADIPIEDIQGIRVPSLQFSGNNTFWSINDSGMTWDSSWPTQTFTNPGLWPYSLDYPSTQDCPLGSCPTASIPGVWVMPMLDLSDSDNVKCAMADACVNMTFLKEGLYCRLTRNIHQAMFI